MGAALPLRQGTWGTVGFGWLTFNLEDAYREDSMHFAYGREVLFDGLFLGGTAKILKRSFGSDEYTRNDPLFTKNGDSTSNMAFDFGVMYRPSASYSFAVAVRDFNEPNVALNPSAIDKVPREIRGGFAYHQRRMEL